MSIFANWSPEFVKVNYEYLLEGGIHKIELFDVDKGSVDELFTVMDYALIHTPLSETIKFLIINHGKLPSVNYLFSKSQELQAKHEKHPTKAAMVFNEIPILMGVLDTFIETLKAKNRRKVFEVDQQAQAIEWLLNK